MVPLDYAPSISNVAVYNVGFRNRVLSSLTAERLQIIYANDGIQGVREQMTYETRKDLPYHFEILQSSGLSGPGRRPSLDPNRYPYS